jgi:hypothetical protein
MRRCSAALSATAGLVFCLFLSREIVSLALGWFPEQGWLWRLSYAFGYELMPVLSTLRAHLELPWATPMFLIALVVMAAVALRWRSRFLSALAIHLAAVGVWSCWIASTARHPALYASADTSVPAWVLAAGRPSLPSILTSLSIGLLLACIVAHADYIRSLAARRGRTLA